ncbi:hypothetical protein DFQ01_12738 [Paenibacillus cellulosilyticus]|uniref:Uncharacterized protein n=1 Tax=Paenibacillus cellulosilyticus TaxID=375489 RepID=A0A2V2YM74_9BACL|nr:hypothetical protein DFQ01_12738 [Paenibacillus cellulosilyticus]
MGLPFPGPRKEKRGMSRGAVAYLGGGTRVPLWAQLTYCVVNKGRKDTYKSRKAPHGAFRRIENISVRKFVFLRLSSQHFCYVTLGLDWER